MFTTDLKFHLNNARQLWLHMSGRVPERLLVRQRDISRGMNERCGKCHEQEYSAWSAGPHGASYAKIFLNPEHNSHRIVSDQCLLCHGMFFEGDSRELIQPRALAGPWHMSPDVSPQTHSIPCIACHSVHRPGTPAGMISADGTNHAKATIQLSFFDRREQLPFDVAVLPLPHLLDGTRPVRVAPDQRQALCYQCHAPDHTAQAGSGEDRTGVGVHEGFSCFACHQGHDQSPRASCATCHPQLSNCGLDVETMDTTFRSKSSTHNIHSVKCTDCHPGGRPAKRTAVNPRADAN
ncbi:MAG: cytochrome c3 family protein [Verrucomicrobiota bacterium]